MVAAKFLMRCCGGDVGDIERRCAAKCGQPNSGTA
jgi:hypothetical protein